MAQMASKYVRTIRFLEREEKKMPSNEKASFVKLTKALY